MTRPRPAVAERTRCFAYACEADGTEPIEVGFNELAADGMERRRERIWVCPEHLRLVAAEILRASE